jgi:CubicO group peptidase (beta-lactamase class C family)
MRTLLVVVTLVVIAWLAVWSARSVDAPAEATVTATAAGIRQADSLVEAWVRAERIPGAVLLASRRGSVVLHEAYGWAQVYEFGSGQYAAGGGPGTPAPRASGSPASGAPAAVGGSGRRGLLRLAEPRAMTEHTVFDLASVTKVMATTMAVMLLVDRGMLDVDQPVRTYLPDFQGGGKEEITLRHLLTHRAGLHQWKPVYYHATNADESYAYIRDLPLEWGVGESRHYSDLGFMLLGRVVEQVSGASLGAFLQEHLYGPLGLRATGYRPWRAGAAAPRGSPPVAATSQGNPFEHRMVHDSTFGYLYEGDPFAWSGWRQRTLVGEVNDGNAFHAFGGEAGHAGLFAGASDLQVLLQLLLDGGTHDGRRLIDRDVVETFLMPQGPGQALGWLVPDYAPAGSFAHTGFTGTFVLGVPAQELAVVLLTNRQNFGVDDEGGLPDIDPLQRGVAAALMGAER